MSSHRERDLVLFLAGDLPPEESEEFDRHLLSCEDCWSALGEDRAGQAAAARLRAQPAAELTGRVRAAVHEAEASPRPPAASPERPGRRWRRVAGAAAAAAVVAVTAGVAVHAGQSPDAPVSRSSAPEVSDRTTAAERTAIAAVARHHTPTGTIHTDRGDAVIATSPTMFAMPADAVRVSADGMAWSATRGSVTLYCLNNDHPSVLLAGSHGLGQLIALAHTMHLDR